jgi:hypothetical protein
MPGIIPTPVTKLNLIDAAHAINLMGGTVASPRTSTLQWITVEDAEVPGAFYTQKHFTGEWILSGGKNGLAVNTIDLLEKAPNGQVILPAVAVIPVP